MINLFLIDKLFLIIVQLSRAIQINFPLLRIIT